VLLAPLTEGATLIPAAAISGYNLYQHGEEFAQQSALAGTDFDKALAISADEPSSFWLALDAVLFLADTSAALKAFEKLSTLIPQIREARTLEEAKRMVRTAVPEGVTEGGHLVICSEPCQWMRERFARQLGRDSTFENRLADLGTLQG
jgi:hypothetical protein